MMHYRFTAIVRAITILSLLFLLCGCSQEPPGGRSLPTEEAAVPTTSPMGLYVPGSALEKTTAGAVRTYPLGWSNARGVISFADGLLVFSGEENTTLTLLTGENLTISASAALDFPLSHQDPSLRIWENTLSYFDSAARETVVLDDGLQPVSHIAAPADLSGVPVLSEDRNTLYYCTSRALVAWNQETGIHQTLKEMSYPGQSAAGLSCQDSVVQCSAESGYLFIAADTGRLVTQWDSALELTSRENRFYAAFPLGFGTALVFGSGEDTRILLPDVPADHFYLPENQALVSASQPGENQLRLDCYSLEDGTRGSQLILDTGAFPRAITGNHGFVWILMDDAAFGCDTLYRWDPAAMPINDGKNYTSPYLLHPEEADLAQCRDYADKLAQTQGIEILVGKEAAQVQPWDYHLEAEVQPGILMDQLQKLALWLSYYPQGVLADTASNFSSLKLCLVRSVAGAPESGSVSEATGVQFVEGTDAYVAIAGGRFAEQALYHELFHVMETHILINSSAYDRWDTLNPTGFSYDYSYSANAVRDSGIYLHGDTRAFIDTYSMSFPKEDRARILEYAMLSGCEAHFEAKPMQAKLRALCEGLRDAYDLEESQESFRWEQYLK